MTPRPDNFPPEAREEAAAVKKRIRQPWQQGHDILDVLIRGTDERDSESEEA